MIPGFLHYLTFTSFTTVLVIVFLIFILFYLEKANFILCGLVILYFLSGLYHMEDLTSFHIFLVVSLVYLCYLTWEKTQITSSNFLLSLLIAGFIVFINHWEIIFILISIVSVISFLFLEMSPYLNMYLGLEGEYLSKPSISNSKDRLKSFIYNIYYDPKYLRLIGFWEKTFPERIRMCQATHGMFLEVLSLVFLSLSTILHTRFKFLLPTFFFRCLFLGHPMWILWYFLPVGFLTLLVSYPPFVNFLQKTYHKEVLKEIGWNAGTSQVIAGVRTAFGTAAGGSFLVLADEFISLKYVNPGLVDKEWADYRKNHITWSEARNLNPLKFHDFPNEPTPPNVDEIHQKRIRTTLLQAFQVKQKIVDIFPKIRK